MIESTSILCRLPANLDKKQALFLNGIRHAAEFASHAYLRLAGTLTYVALHDIASSNATHQYTSAFIDAWTIVDAFDRFRQLALLFPNPGNTVPTLEIPASDLALLAREVRNVADHLAQRADFVTSKSGTALGILTWYTVLDASTHQGVSCTILPGGVPTGSHDAVNPAGKDIRVPTDLIHLTAGGYRISLSELVVHMSNKVNELEEQVSAQLPANLAEDKIAPTDILLKIHMCFAPPQA